jgi:rhodanese-related sulfurtransferase
MCEAKKTKMVKTVADHAFRAYYPNAVKVACPKDYNVKVVVKDLKPGAFVFYFAAKSGSVKEDSVVKDRVWSYDTLQNSGVVKVDANGVAEMKLSCPRVYYNPENRRAYPRHVHFTYALGGRVADDGKPWAAKLFTQTVFCPVTARVVKDIVRDESAVIIDALPASYYKKEHIKGAINIPHDELAKYTAAVVKKMLREANPRLFEKTGNVRHIPLVLYCYSKECNAAEHLKEHLDKLGFVNTWHYEGGISEWKGAKAGAEARARTKASKL